MFCEEYGTRDDDDCECPSCGRLLSDEERDADECPQCGFFMCCEEYFECDDSDEANGVCPDCGYPTCDGVTVMPGCGYSPVACETCGWRPCDQSC